MPSLLTMIFTDIVESTATKRDVAFGRDSRERDQAYLAQVQTPHFNLVRDCCRKHDGQEVSTMGDAFFLAFDDPVGAVRCAVDIQKRLATEPIETPRGPLRLRIGLHSGFPEAFEGSYHGTDVDKTARVEATASAQQILLSSTTYELVRNMTDVPFRFRGEFALKGIGSVGLWEVDWDGSGPRPTSTLPLAVQYRKKRARVIAVAVPAVSLVLALVSYRHRRSPPLPFNIRRSVAVLGFKNVSQRPDTVWMSSGLSDALTSELGADQKLRTIPEENVARMKIDLALGDVDSFAADTLERIRKALGSDYVVAGSYSALGVEPNGAFQLDLRLQDATTGDIIASDGETATVKEFFEVARKAGDELRQKLGVGPIAAAQSAAVGASLPPSTEVARFYAEGLAKLREFDPQGARELFEKAIAADPNFPLAHSALAEAWQMLGYDAKAQAEAKFARDLAFQLIPEERKLIEGRFEEMSSDWEAAASTYKSLWDVFADNIEYGLLLARAQTSGGKGNDAIATLAAARRLPPPTGEDPRIDLAEAYADDATANFQQSGQAAAQAAHKAEQVGARSLVAQALVEQCWALGNLNQAAPARTACEKAQDTFAAVGDLLGQARSFTRLSALAVNAGNIDQALDLRTKALTLAQQVGSHKDVSGALINIGYLQASRGELETGRKSLDDALAVAREIDFKKDELDAENNLGTVYQSLCDYEKAKDSYEQSRQIAEAVGDKAGEATATYNLGSILYLLGDLSIAQSQVQQAITQAKELGMRTNVVQWLMTLGDIRMDQDDLAGAEKAYQESHELIAADEKGGEALPGPMALYDVEMAGLQLEKGQSAEAEKMARGAAEYYQGVKDAGNEAGARELLARSLMAANKLPAAASEVERAEQLHSTDCGVLVPLAITRIRIQARSGQAGAARQGIESVMNEATTKKLQGYELAARLAQAEIDLETGDARRARSELKTLQNDATFWRYLLIARKARELSQAGKTMVAAGAR